MAGGSRWEERAACVGLSDPDVMFPDATNVSAVARARDVCMGCPVLAACLEAALAEEGEQGTANRFGVRGGLTPFQRHRIYWFRRPPPEGVVEPRAGGRKPAACGTPAAYDRHCRMGEPIDDACRDAHNEKNRAQKAKQRAAKTGATA